MGAGASRQTHAHYSLNCRDATVIEFINSTDGVVTTTWLDYSGLPRAYFALAPGGRVRQPTFTAHPWTFVPEAPDVPPCVVDDQPVYYAPPGPQGGPPPQAHIRHASPLPWSPAHHLQFPPSFRAQVAALLCCQRRLSAPLPTAPARTLYAMRLQQLHWHWRHQWQRQLTWLQRLCPRAARAVQQLAGTARVPMMAAAYDPVPVASHGQSCSLGDLPKELLLEVVAAAAPSIPLLAKPPLPHGVDPQELPSAALHLLFEPTATINSSSSMYSSSDGEADGEAAAAH